VPGSSEAGAAPGPLGSAGAGPATPGDDPAGGSDTGPLSGAGAELAGPFVGAPPDWVGGGFVPPLAAGEVLGGGVVVVVVVVDLRLVLLRPSLMVVEVVGMGLDPGAVWADTGDTTPSCDIATRTGRTTMRARTRRNTTSDTTSGGWELLAASVFLQASVIAPRSAPVTSRANLANTPVV
jgi:hypothetical protein